MSNIIKKAWQGKSEIKTLFWGLLFMPALLFIALSGPIYFIAMIASGDTRIATPVSLVAPVLWLIYVAKSFYSSRTNQPYPGYYLWAAAVVIAFIVGYLYLVIEYQSGIESIG